MTMVTNTHTTTIASRGAGKRSRGECTTIIPLSVKDFYKNKANKSITTTTAQRPIKKKHRRVKHYYEKIGMCLERLQQQVVARGDRMMMIVSTNKRTRRGGLQIKNYQSDARNKNEDVHYDPFDDIEDRMAILVHNDTRSLEQLKRIYHDAMLGRRRPSKELSLTMMQLLGCLIRVRDAAWGSNNHKNNFNNHHIQETQHDDIETVALFLAKGLSFRHRPCLDKVRRLCLLFLLNSCNATTTTNNKDEEDQNDTTLLVDLQATINFLAGLATEIPDGLVANCPVWWELRAHVSAHKRKICRHATGVASFIADGATHVEFGLHTGANLVCTGVQKTGHWVQSQTTQAATATDAALQAKKNRGQVVGTIYSDTARRVADKARDTTRDAMDTMVKMSGAGLAQVKARITQNGSVVVLPPWAEAAGQVGMAGMGAFVVVGETVVLTTRQVIVKVADTAADLVQHRYGTWAGQSMRDCTSTIGSLWLTAGSGLTLVSPHAWTRVVARHGCKEHLRQHQNQKYGIAGEKKSDAENEAIFDQALKFL